MPQFRVSVEAEDDLERIANYTIGKFGQRQTDSYLTKLEEGFERLAKNPSIGRACDSIFSGLRRFEIDRHVVFYVTDSEGILVVRVLHRRMLPARHF